MESSTPLQKSSNLRRLTLIKNTAELSPLRKSNAVLSPITSILEHSNDDLERSRRRSNVEIQKRLSNITQDEVIFTNSFIKEQFVLCTHLYAENKITSKNAWKVQIINMLKPLCQQLGKDNLQAIGTSIDISAKVYGLRVDDMYTDGLKLANTLARNAHSGQNDGDDEGDPENQIEKECVRKKSKRKRVNVDGQKNTVSKNPQSLMGSIIKLEPVDFLSRVKAETGTIDNLFTNVLKEDKIGSTFLLINEKNTNACDELVINNDEKEINLEKLPQLKEATLHVNIPFKQFMIDDWDPDQEEHHLSVEKSQLNEIITDKNGFPTPELDGSVHDIFADDNHLDDEIIHEEIVPQLRGGLQKIVDFQPSKDTVQFSEYSYNTVVNMRTGKCIDQIWAGPSHWKLKFLRNRRSLFSGQIALQKESNKMKKKDQPMISYEDNVEIDTSKKYVTKKKNTIVDESKITLPLQDQFCVNFLKNLNELMLKPGVFREIQNKNSDPSDYEISSYRYENPNDSLYCSQKNNQNDNVRDEGDCGVADNDGNDSSLGENPELGALLDAPETVTNQYITYSKKAKQINIKELKYAVWKVLTRSSINPNAKVQEISFSDMFKQIPALLSKKENEELSCPLAFVALLHLANEQNLHLVQMEGFKDFYIKCTN